ncbi:MAG: UbiA-like polyprenyltransferase [Nitrospirota bacterium]|jgi:4-hydroxybenzoate polyprenyltransferase
MAALRSIETYLRMIRFSHSVFALPFALTSAVIAAGGLPTAWQTFWIVVAMVGARSGAMGMNRIIDRTIDAANPRTRAREVASGKISLRAALLFSLLSFAVLVLAAWMLNPLCLRLSPLAIAIVVFYSYTKRFTWAAHFVLGAALALAPLGAWVAIRGSFDAEVLPLVLAVAFWLPGFDVLYALQDIEFDRSYGLYSIPSRFGTRASLLLARMLHGLSLLCLYLTGAVFGLGLLYWLGMLAVTGLFVYEHSIVRADDLSRLDMAFFNMNGYISVAVFVFTFLDYVL